MRSFVSFRLTAQICIASAVLCLFSPFRERWPAFVLLLGLMLIAGLGAGGCSKPSRRLLWGLLPLPALALPGSDWMVRAALLILNVYAVLFLTLGRFAPEIWRYRRSVLLIFVLCLVLLVVSGLGTVTSTPPRLFSAAGLVLALLALRTLQMGSAPSARWQAGNVGLFFLPVAGGALAGTALWLSAPGLKYLVYVLSAALAGVVSLWNTFWTRLQGLFSIGEDFFEETPVEIPLPDVAGEIAPEAAAEPSASVQMPEVQVPWGSILALLAAAVLILLAVYLLRKGAPVTKREKQENELIEEALIPEPRTRRGRRKKSTDRTNRGQIRLIYREYLAFLKSQNIRPNQSATTAEISAAAASVLAESDEQLREIYRRSRYSDEPVTQEDVLSARESLDGILRSKDKSPA